VIEWGLAKASPKVRVRMEESMDPNIGLPPVDELNMDHMADGRLFLVMVQVRNSRYHRFSMDDNMHSECIRQKVRYW